jgi:hypothetical protein
MGKQVLISILFWFIIGKAAHAQDTLRPGRSTPAEAITKAKLLAVWQPRNIIAISPNGFFPRLKYECKLTNDISAGTEVRAFLYMFRGIRVDPFVRYYIKYHTAPIGWFIQLKGSFALVHTNGLYETYLGEAFYDDYDSLGNPIPPPPDVYLPFTWTYAYGGGITAGHQHLIGKRKHGIVEFFFGFKIIGTKLNFSQGSFFWQEAALCMPIDAGIKFGYAWKKEGE